MDVGCRWSSGNNHSLRGRVRCVVLIASFREARVRGLALKKRRSRADYSRGQASLVDRNLPFFDPKFDSSKHDQIYVNA